MSSAVPNKKPVVGISCGDINGIGPEIIIKSLSDSRILDFCIPVIFGNNKVFNYYRKGLTDINFNFSAIRDLSKLNPRQVNLLNVWEEEVPVSPGELNETGGIHAVKSLSAAVQAFNDHHIDALVTAPVHKKNVHSEAFPYTGHTPFLKAFFNVPDVLMLMVAGNFRVALVTEHLPVKDVAAAISRQGIFNKLSILNDSLRKDFNVQKPKIAVLALNPHAGDEGLLGSEEEEIIKPAIKEAKQHNMLVMGPYAADAFFARGQQHKFDAVLAMYHDQGLIPFKSLAMEEGINYTAGLNLIRTSPDHGTAFDIAGKGLADSFSFTAALFEAINIYNRRNFFDEIRKDPLRKNSNGIAAASMEER